MAGTTGFEPREDGRLAALGAASSLLQIPRGPLFVLTVVRTEERARRDLNPRHLGPEPRTLSTELRALTVWKFPRPYNASDLWTRLEPTPAHS